MERTILVPFDGSPSSIQATKFVLSMVSEKDQIIFINVQKPQYEGFEKVGKISKGELDRFYYQKGEEILNKAEEVIGEQRVRLKKLVRIGLPSIEITKAAKEFSVYSIVMGSIGMSPAVSSALGSVTYSVIHLAPCPITIVPFIED